MPYRNHCVILCVCLMSLVQSTNSSPWPNLARSSPKKGPLGKRCAVTLIQVSRSKLKVIVDLLNPFVNIFSFPLAQLGSDLTSQMFACGQKVCSDLELSFCVRVRLQQIFKKNLCPDNNFCTLGLSALHNPQSVWIEMS